MENQNQQPGQNEGRGDERPTPSWIKEEMKRKEEIKKEEGEKQEGLQGDVRAPREETKETMAAPEKTEPKSFKEELRPREEPEEPKRAKKFSFPSWLKYTLLVVLIVIAGVVVYFFFFYKSTLEISISQEDAEIVIGEEKIGPGITKIRPGLYQLVVERDGFVKYEKEVRIEFFEITSLSIALKEIPEIKKISDQKTKFLAYNKERDAYIYFVPKESAFYRVENTSSDKHPILTSPHQIKNLINVVWNPDRLTAILKIKNENSVLSGTPFHKPDVSQGAVMTFLYDFGRYDLLHQEAHFWGTGIGDAEFTPDGNQVAYFFEPGTGEKSLVVANKNNGEINRVLDMRAFSAAKISWAKDLKSVVIADQSTDYDNNQIYVYDLIQKELFTLTESGRIINAVFGPESEKIIYSTYLADPDFSGKSVLSVMDSDGKGQKELGIRAYINQLEFSEANKFLVFDEENKASFKLKMVDIGSGQKTNYVYKEINDLSPEGVEYIESKNLLIFISQETVYSLDLVTEEYE